MSTTTFCQGKTQRWAICWTFDPVITLKVRHVVNSKVSAWFYPCFLLQDWFTKTKRQKTCLFDQSEWNQRRFDQNVTWQCSFMDFRRFTTTWGKFDRWLITYFWALKNNFSERLNSKVKKRIARKSLLFSRVVWNLILGQTSAGKSGAKRKQLIWILIMVQVRQKGNILKTVSQFGFLAFWI